jgi:predicted RND superfamily exporter protein
LYDPDFAQLYRESDVDNDGVPDGNIQTLLDYLSEENPELVSDSLLRDEKTGKYTVMLMSIKVDTNSMENAGEVHDILKEETAPLEELEEDGTIDRSVVTGEPILMDVMLTTINESMIMSILITIVISAIFVSGVFYYSHRSAVLGLVTILPVVLVLVWIMGSMFLLGLSLNVLTIVIGAITIGLGITYAIHVTHRFTEELEEHGDIDRAVHNTVVHTGTALFGAALTTMVGFGILALSPQVPMQQFGGLTALTIFYSYTFSVYVQPSLLVIWARATCIADAPHPLSQRDSPLTKPKPAGIALAKSMARAMSVLGIFMVWVGRKHGLRSTRTKEPARRI